MNKEVKIEELVQEGIYFLQCRSESREEGWIFEFNRIGDFHGNQSIFDERCVNVDVFGNKVDSYQDNCPVTIINNCRIFEATEKQMGIFEGVSFYE